MTCRKFKAQLGDPTTTLDGLDCTPTSTAMAMYRATCGKVDVTGGQVRARCLNPDGTADVTGGTNLGQVVDAAATWGVKLTNKTRHSFDDFLADVRAGRGAILQGDYDQLRTCSSTFLGSHAIYVESAAATSGVVGDPLCTDFRTLSLASLRAYAEKLGLAELGASLPQQIFYAVTEPDVAQPAPGADMPAAAPAPMSIYFLVDVAAGGTAYYDAASTSPAIAATAALPGVLTYGTFVRADGKTMRDIRVQLTTGGPLIQVWVGEDKCSNLRIIGATPPAPADTTPFSQADIDAARAAGIAAAAASAAATK